MKLAVFCTDPAGEQTLGVLDASDSRILALDTDLFPAELPGLCALGPEGRDRLEAWRRQAPASAWRALSDVRLGAPLMPRRNVFCVGKNYRPHAEEFHRSGFDSSSAATESAEPALPVVFTKAPTAVIGPGEAIPSYLDETGTTDYEGELGVVIGVGGRAIAPDRAMDHVFGFTIINDVTSRQLQRDHRQWFIGKSADGFCPMGPWVATKDELADLGAARLRTFVDGELRQDAVFADMIFDVPTIIATISRRTTLWPGDVIATGTPEGVGIGFAPPRYLRPGSIVRIEIDGIGVLENPVA
ncbi:MAG TPA: fumarylacetoacetate hydrolase family protein [Burkholderiaceae bacterium]|nr:fumarylacetoacetate hydrolase family protein [Burkholderiaceae bacterium]